MKYEASVAEYLHKKYRISDSTMNLWQTNDEIPDYYLSKSKIDVFGMDLREARKFLGYTFDVALLILKKHGLSISRVSLSQWERGKVDIKEKNKKAIVGIYKKLIKNKKQLLGL